MSFADTVGQTIEFVVVTVIFKVIIVHWLADKLLALLKFILVRSERQAVIWVHYYDKALGRAHKYPSPMECQDGLCKSFFSKHS